MSTKAKQAMTQPIDPKYTDALAGLKGHRNNKALVAAFPESPIFPKGAGDAVYTDAGATAVGIVALNGGSAELPSFITNLGTADGVVSDGAHMFSEGFDLNFKGNEQDQVPNLADVETGGGGLPASPYVPNLSSVGEGQLANPGAQPEYEGPLPTDSGQIGQGLAATSADRSPHVTSEKISANTIGSYIRGKSYAGSPTG